jgi:hypothetical protein
VVLAGDPQTNMDNNDYNHRPACRPAGCIRGGDANHDDRVNVIDFSILKTLFGQAGYVVADFDNNQVVNVTDFHVILTNFGQTGAPPVGVVGW